MSDQLEGFDSLSELLGELADEGARSVSSAMLNAGMSVLASRMKSNSKGQIRLEIGKRRTPSVGDIHSGVVGLGVAGKEKRVKRAHGHFIAAGTRKLAPNNFIRDAVNSSRGTALNAARLAGLKRLKKLTEGRL